MVSISSKLICSLLSILGLKLLSRDNLFKYSFFSTASPTVVRSFVSSTVPTICPSRNIGMVTFCVTYTLPLISTNSCASLKMLVPVDMVFTMELLFLPRDGYISKKFLYSLTSDLLPIAGSKRELYTIS